MSDSIDFAKLGLDTLSNLMRTNDISQLPVEYQEYYKAMDFVRTHAAKHTFNGKPIPKSRIIKMVSTSLNISQYQARIVYNDAINFFFIDTSVSSQAFANLYADKLEDAASVALMTNQLAEYKDLIKEAAKLRGCYKEKAPEIPKELHRKQFVIYTTDIEDLGGKAEDPKEIEKQINELPDVPALVKDRLKMEAGISKFDVFKMMADDADAFDDETNS